MSMLREVPLGRSGAGEARRTVLSLGLTAGAANGEEASAKTAETAGQS